MGLTVGDMFKASSPRGEIKPDSKTGRIYQQMALESSLLEAIAKGGLATSIETTADGKVRMKIRVKKEDLKGVLHAMKMASSDAKPSASPEQRLSLLRKKVLARRGGQWKPRLQSIPEERC